MAKTLDIIGFSDILNIDDMKLIRKIFSKEELNTGRQIEVDLGKAINVFFLAFIHCIIECTSEEGLCSGIPYVFDTIIGGPLSAPMFMFAMGFGMVYTKKNTPHDYIIRGLKLAILNFAFNIVRYGIPYAVGFAVSGDYNHYIEPLMYRILCNDILLFAGLAMMLVGLLKHLRLNSAFIWCVGLVMSVVGMFFIGTDVNSPIGNILLGYFVGTEDKAGMVFSDFPLLNWFITVATGYLFASVLKRVKEKRLFYLCISPFCVIITVIYFAVGIINEYGMFGEGQNCYYHITTPDVLIAMTGAVGLLGIYYFITRFTKGLFNRLVSDISANMTAVYCIHWVFVVWITNVLVYLANGTQELPLWITLLISLAISIVSIAIAHFYGKYKRRRTANEKTQAC